MLNDLVSVENNHCLNVLSSCMWGVKFSACTMCLNLAVGTWNLFLVSHIFGNNLWCSMRIEANALWTSGENGLCYFQKKWLAEVQQFHGHSHRKVLDPWLFVLPVDQLGEETVHLLWKLQGTGNYLRGNLFPECELACWHLCSAPVQSFHFLLQFICFYSHSVANGKMGLRFFSQGVPLMLQ